MAGHSFYRISFSYNSNPSLEAAMETNAKLGIAPIDTHLILFLLLKMKMRNVVCSTGSRLKHLILFSRAVPLQ